MYCVRTGSTYVQVSRALCAHVPAIIVKRRYVRAAGIYTTTTPAVPAPWRMRRRRSCDGKTVGQVYWKRPGRLKPFYPRTRHAPLSRVKYRNGEGHCIVRRLLGKGPRAPLSSRDASERSAGVFLTEKNHIDDDDDDDDAVARTKRARAKTEKKQR